MSIKAALLDAPAASGKGKFLRIDELEDESLLTANHVPGVTVCDLPPDRYVWTGDHFQSIEAVNRRNKPGFDKAFTGLCDAITAAGIKLPEDTVAYLDDIARRAQRRKPKGAQ